MKIAVVGSGGREHTIIKKIKMNPEVSEIYALPGNGGIAKDATCVDIGAKDIDGVVKFAKENAIDYVVVAPDICEIVHSVFDTTPLSVSIKACLIHYDIA